ncbi:MAG: SPOR domain-containing protein [Candidatus Omnitrophica bacterium]|nr:SPOR domain-containing protein [Candidatus Omnitrophota bacterium]
MENGTTQQELFGEFKHPAKRRRRQANTILPKNYVLFNITYEQIIFTSIAVIMLMVLLFSLGVERGKRLDAVVLQQQDTFPQAVEIVAAKEPAVEEAVEVVEKKEVLPKAPNGVPALYTVQVIAYRSKKLAQKELVRLSKKGFTPFIIVGGGYYQICIGEYKDKETAKKDFGELKKTYRDSFIRKR